jgi:hypothetical protein
METYSTIPIAFTYEDITGRTVYVTPSGETYYYDSQASIAGLGNIFQKIGGFVKNTVLPVAKSIITGSSGGETTNSGVDSQVLKTIQESNQSAQQQTQQLIQLQLQQQQVQQQQALEQQRINQANADKQQQTLLVVGGVVAVGILGVIVYSASQHREQTEEKLDKKSSEGLKGLRKRRKKREKEKEEVETE